MDRADFETEALGWADTVWRVARWMADDPNQADDLVQETYLRAFKSWKTYQDGTDCRSWLLRILRNAAVDLSRRKKLPTIHIDDADGREPADRTSAHPGAATAAARDAEGWGTPEAWAALLAKSTDDAMFAAVQGLAEPFRSTFCLVVLGDCTHKEAAEMLECSEGTIKSRLSRAAAQLRGVLEPRKPVPARRGAAVAGVR